MMEYASSLLGRKRQLLLILNACLFAYLASWLYRNIDISELALEMGRIPPGAVLRAMAMNVAVLCFYALRLAAILGGRAASCFVITTVGFTFNSVFPFRVGEGVKVYVGKAYFGYAIGILVAGIVVEKLYDLSALALLSVFVGKQAFDTSSLNILAIVLLTAGAGLVVSRHKLRGLLRAVGEWRIAKAARLDALIASVEAVVVSHNPSRAAFFTLAIWLTHASLVFLLFTALLPGMAFSFSGAITVMLVGALALAVPASPAGLGVFEAGVVALLINVYGVSKERALSTALAYHFSITAPHTLFAIVFLSIGLARQLRSNASQ